MSAHEVDIIKDARELLSDPKRWHKGGLMSPDGTAVCLVGALDRVTWKQQRTLPYLDARVRAEDLLVEHLPPGHEGEGLGLRPVAHFNDDELTTHQDVLDLLDKTLADLGGLA